MKEEDESNLNNVDEVESLEEEPSYETSSNDLVDNPSNVVEDNALDNNYNPQNRYRRNQEYHSRDYYKDKVNETGDKRNQAKNNAEESRQKRDAAKDSYKQSKKNYRDNKSDKDLRDQAKDNKKAAKQEYKAAKKEDKDAKREYRDAKSANRQAKLDQASDTANRVLHPVETGKNYLRNKVNQFNPVNKIKNKAKQGLDSVKDKAKQGVKNTAKKAGNAAKEGAKKAGQAAAKGAQAAGKTMVSGIAKLIAMVPPPVWIGIAAILALLIAAMIIVVIVMGDEDEELVNVSTIACAYENLNGIGEDTMVKIMDCDGSKEITSVALEKYISGVAINDLGSLYGSEVSKAYLIIMRSNILYSAINDVGNYTYDSGEDVIIVNQCEDAPLYWNYSMDLYQSDTNPNEYSSEASEGFTLLKESLSEDAKAIYEQSAEEVSCMYLTDKDNKPISIDLDVDTLIQKATANAGTDNGSYTGLLVGNSDATNINRGQVNYNSYFSSDVGDYAKWKQCDKAWGSISIGSNTVCTHGCFLVSMAMLVAHSGVDTGNILDFNPGTFTNGMKSEGAISSGGGTNQRLIYKVIPNFEFVKAIDTNNDYSKLKELADSGCYIALEVKSHCSGQHWVAIDNAASAAVNWQQIYIWDPSSSKDPTLDHTYKTKSGKTCHYNANKADCFKRIK